MNGSRQLIDQGQRRSMEIYYKKNKHIIDEIENGCIYQSKPSLNRQIHRSTLTIKIFVQAEIRNTLQKNVFVRYNGFHILLTL